MKMRVLLFFGLLIIVAPLHALTPTQEPERPERIMKQTIEQKVEVGVGEKRREDFRRAFASREAHFQDRINKTKEMFEQERAGFKAKLQQFQDKNKAAVAENVDIKLQNANTQRTEQFTKTLERLTVVLQKLQQRVDTAPETYDKTSAQMAIDAAGKSIQDAQTAVSSQAAKSYKASVTSESAIGSSLGTTMKSLRADLQVTQEFVKKARAAVVDAARAVYKLPVVGVSDTTNESTTAPAAAN